MALTLDISPDIETLIRLKAAQNGQDITAYLLKLVESDLDVDLSEFAGLEDYAASVREFRRGWKTSMPGTAFLLKTGVQDWKRI